MSAAIAVLVLGVLLSPPQAAPEDRVSARAGDLESPDPKKIYRAVDDLVALGEAALPALESRAKAAPGRTRDYLALAIDEIRCAKLLGDLPRARRVSMKATDRNVVELLGDLRARTGLPISLDNLMGEEKLPEIAVDFREATLLEAFDAICRVGNVALSMDNGQFALYLGDYQEVPRFFYDHYFFRLQNFVLMKTVDFRKPAAQTFRIEMELLWNPAAAPLRFGPLAIQEAVDDRGKNLILPPPAAGTTPEPGSTDAPEEGLTSSMFFVSLQPPSPGAERIRILRGTTTISLPRSRVTAVFDAQRPSSEKPATRPAGGSAPREGLSASETAQTLPSSIEGQTRTAGGFTIKVLKSDPAQCQFTCVVTCSTHPPKELERIPFLSTVVLKGGEPTRSSVSLNVKEDSAELIVSYQPLHLKEVLVQPAEDRPAPPPAVERFELSIVTGVQERKIPFEYRDVKIK